MKIEAIDRFHPDTSQDVLLSGASQIVQRLYTLLGTIGPSFQSKQFSIHARAKTPTSITEKVSRKRKGNPNRKESPKPDYSFRSLTDLVGLRLVVLYDDELKDAIEYVGSLIVAGQFLPDPLFSPGFIWDNFVEARFIQRTGDANDPYAIARKTFEKLVQNDCRKQIPPKNRDDILEEKRNIFTEVREGDRYSSAHIIYNATAYIGQKKILIPVEFQFRTAAENIWAEIIHSYYKIDSSHVWSTSFQKHASSADQQAKDLKTKIDDLPGDIQKFRDAAGRATEAVSSFWNEDAKKRCEIVSSASLCASLFVALDEKEYPVLTRQWTSYAGEIKKLNLFNGKKDRARVVECFASALKRISGIERIVRDQLENVPTLPETYDLKKENLAEKAARLTNESSTKLFKERLYLLDLEKLRLRTLALTSAQCIFNEDGKHIDISNPSKNDEERHKLANDLYSRFCEYYNKQTFEDHHLSVFPACMILYFKYLLTSAMKGQVQAHLLKHNLFAAFKLVNTDKTLPYWTIYRVLLPRAMSAFLSTEVSEIIEHFDDEQRGTLLRDMAQLGYKVQRKLIGAVMYAQQATDIHDLGASKEDNANRGDLTHGFLAEEAIFDVTCLIDMCEFYTKTFDFEGALRLDQRLLPAERQLIKETLLRFINRSGSNVAGKNLIARARQIVGMMVD